MSIVYFVVLFILGLIASVCLVSYICLYVFFGKTIFKYTYLLNLKTDWYMTYLEYLAKKILTLFNASFVSILSTKKGDTVKELVSLGDNTTKLLPNSVIKTDFSFIKTPHRILKYVYSTNNIFTIESQDLLKTVPVKYSFMLPISFDRTTDEDYLCLFFRNKFLCYSMYLFMLPFHPVFTKILATILRNFYAHFSASSSMLLEEMEDYVAISLDQDAYIVSWNKGAEKLFSYRSFEIIKQKFSVLFNFDERDTFNKSLEILAVKNSVKFFATLKDRMNIPIRVELTIKVIRANKGELLGYSIFVKDITKEEIFKENIQQHSFINYTILENSQDGMLILDNQDKIIFYNQRVRLILDNSMNLFGIPGKKIFPRQFGDEFENAITTLKESGKEFIDIDYCFDGKYYNIRFFQVYRNTNNEYGGVIVFFIDESVRMLTLLELEEKQNALEKINAHLLDALDSARKLQHSIVPMLLPNEDKFESEAIYELSDDLGGDFYYVENIVIGGKEYGIIFISDVSGHGISSSMLNIMVKEVYGTYKELLEVQGIVETSSFLYILNKKMIDLNMPGNKFITCFIAVIDFEENTIQMSSAGHPLPFLIKKDSVQLLSFPKTIPIGIIDQIECPIETISFDDDDKLIFYTDGFLDLFDNGDPKPANIILEYLNENKDLSIKELKNDILAKYDSFKEERKSFTDDLTIIISKLKTSQK